jgi:hypothetical protein
MSQLVSTPMNALVGPARRHVHCPGDGLEGVIELSLRRRSSSWFASAATLGSHVADQLVEGAEVIGRPFPATDHAVVTTRRATEGRGLRWRARLIRAARVPSRP